jgi:hypothetical protein
VHAGAAGSERAGRGEEGAATFEEPDEKTIQLEQTYNKLKERDAANLIPVPPTLPLSFCLCCAIENTANSQSWTKVPVHR